MSTPPGSPLDDSYAQMARVTDRILEPVALINRDSSVRYANPAAATLFELAPHELVGRKLINFVHPDDRARVVRELALVGDGELEAGFSQLRVRGNSSQPWFIVDCYAHDLTDDPDMGAILVSASDVSDRESAARALRALSDCNDVLVHATDEETLIENICRSIARSGEYMLAWVGYREYDPDQNVRVIASYGATEFLDGLRVSWGEDDHGRGVVGEAIRTGRPQIVRDVHKSKRCAPWAERIEAMNVRSACAFPLVVSGETIGALAIHSQERGVFKHSELELLGKLAKNLSYGIGRLRDGVRLADSEAHLQEAERLARMGHWEWDVTGDHFTFLANEMFSLSEVNHADWKGTFEAFLATVDTGDRPAVEAAFRDVLTRGTSEVIYRVKSEGSEGRWVRTHANCDLGPDGVGKRVVGITLDITPYIKAKHDLDSSRRFLLAITDNMTEGMLATDTEGRITFANAATGRLLGRGAADLIGTGVLDSFRLRRENGHVVEAQQQLSAVWTTGRALNADYDVLMRSDGTTFPVAFNATPLFDDGLRGAVIVFEDITDRAAAQLRVDRELEKLAWIGRVRDALDQGTFVLHAQPIVDLSTGSVLQHELLIRMLDGEGDVVPPGDFLPAAEEYGLITEIDKWVVKETARLAALGHAVEFNLSAKSVADPGMLKRIVSALEEYGAPASNIVCEITETALVRDLAAAEEFVRGLNQLGIKVALDDFGAGYGGFAYLKRLPLSFIKIDREFVNDLAREISSQHVVSAVVNLARAFGMKTIAEGAEDEATLAILRELGVDHVQGYLLGRPRPINEAFADGALSPE